MHNKVEGLRIMSQPYTHSQGDNETNNDKSDKNVGTGFSSQLCFSFPVLLSSWPAAAFIIHPPADADDDGDVDMCFVKGKDKTI